MTPHATTAQTVQPVIPLLKAKGNQFGEHAAIAHGQHDVLPGIQHVRPRNSSLAGRNLNSDTNGLSGAGQRKRLSYGRRGFQSL